MVEEFAVGVGFGGGDVSNGTSLAMEIELQNIPEDTTVAFLLMSIGYTKIKSFIIDTINGPFESFFGLLGVDVVMAFQPILPWALSLATGHNTFCYKS